MPDNLPTVGWPAVESPAVKLRGVVTRLAEGLRRGKARGGELRIGYTPDDDGQPDPGEVVWAWVPFEDDPSQGKDRPVVVIGWAGDRLAVVPTSSRGPDDRPDPEAWVSIGSGRWDREGRASYANVDRILRVRESDVRREGAALDRPHFDTLVAAVRRANPSLT
jgi:hypothetical protein